MRARTYRDPGALPRRRAWWARHYEPLLPLCGRRDKAAPGAWCADDYVTMEDGTGIVHIAPAFGEDDDRVCQINGLPFVQLVDTQGMPDARHTTWAGVFVKEADPADPRGPEGAGPAFCGAALRA